jgi:hypothetical protein
MSDKVSLSLKASNPDQFRMRVVVEEESFRLDKEKLRYSAEQLDEMLSRVIEDIAMRPAEYFSLVPNWGLERIDVDPPLYIEFTFDADCVRLHLIKEEQQLSRSATRKSNSF